MTLVERLRELAGGFNPFTFECMDLNQAADRLEALEAEVAALKTVMIAAAEEIQAHWEAHCDAEGYGPANLMRRLEEGIPSEYGYTAGAFESLRAEVAALRKDDGAWLHVKSGGVYRILAEGKMEATGALVVVYQGCATGLVWVRPLDEFYDGRFQRIDAAIDAAIQQHAADSR